MVKRKKWRKLTDFLLFPLRCLFLHETDRWWGSSLASERFEYVSQEVQGYSLDVGCGPSNRFVSEFLNGQGRGIDVYEYKGLSTENILENPRSFPFSDETFRSVTFIACLNHIPRPLRIVELKEAFRVLVPDGNVVITMPTPIMGVLAHALGYLYEKLMPNYYFMDGERGMGEEEEYFVNAAEIMQLLTTAGFQDTRTKPFVTQWGFNRAYVALKRADSKAVS